MEHPVLIMASETGTLVSMLVPWSAGKPAVPSGSLLLVGTRLTAELEGARANSWHKPCRRLCLALQPSSSPGALALRTATGSCAAPGDRAHLLPSSLAGF